MQRSAFTVTFVALPGVDGIRSFRALLKTALRRFGLRAVDVRELSARNEDERARSSSLSTHSAQTRETTMSAFSDRVRSQREKQRETGVFKVADFKVGEERTYTIDCLVEEVEMFKKTVDLLNFKETGRQLQLNQTTSEWLLDNLGDDPEQWVGKQVTLYLGEYEYDGKKNYGIRLRKPGAAASKPASVDGIVLPPRKDMDDEIPW